MRLYEQRARSRQPQHFTRVRPEWIADGLVACVVPVGLGLYDLVRGIRLPKVGGATPGESVGSNCFGRTFDVGNNWCRIDDSALGGTEYTILSVQSDSLLGGNFSLLGCDDASTNRSFQYRTNGSSKLEFIPFNTGGTPFILEAPNAISAAENSRGWVSLATVHNGTASLWKDGIKLASAAITGTPKGPSVNIAVGARDLSGTDTSYAAFNLIVVMRRGVSDAIAQRLTLDPWQVIDTGERRQIYHSISGGDQTITVSDTSTGADALSIAVAFGLADTGAGADGLAGSAALNLAETGAGTDGIGLTVTFTLADSGAGTDDLSVLTETLIQLAESGSGSDAVSITASVSAAETGAGTDGLALSVSLSISDSGAGSDALDVLQATLITIAETAAGTDGIGAITVAITLPETATGVDAIAIAALVSVLETASGMDVAVVQNPDAARIVTIVFTPKTRAVEFAMRTRSITFTLN